MNNPKITLWMALQGVGSPSQSLNRAPPSFGYLADQTGGRTVRDSVGQGHPQTERVNVL